MSSDADGCIANPFCARSTWSSENRRLIVCGLVALTWLSVQGNILAQIPDQNRSIGNRGCTAKGFRTGLLTQTTLDGSHIVRTYLLQVPESYSTKRAYPVMFVFHGARGSATQAHSWGLQDVKGAAENAIFVYPQGIDFHHEGIGWDDAIGGYDMVLFDTMLSELQAAYCVDDSRIFVAGFSWGADFATSLACSRGDRIRAIAVNSTNDEFGDKSNFMTYRYLPCTASRFPAVRFEHAVEGDSAYPAPYFATTGKLLQHLNGCSKESTPVPSSASTVSCVSSSGCAQEVLECSFDKSIGHKLPPNWAQDTWDFFQSFHPR